MSSPVILWGAGTSRTLRPIWVAEELGVDYELKPIRPRTGETQTARFTQLNPKQKIPVLEDGTLTLSESLAICRYLIRRHPADALFVPQNAEDCAWEDEWCCYVYGELDETSLYVMRRHGDLAHIYGAAPDVVAAAASYAVRHLLVIDAQLQQREYILRGGFGLADIMLMSCLDWAVAYGLEVPDGLLDYRRRIARREAYQRACRVNFADPAQTTI